MTYRPGPGNPATSEANRIARDRAALRRPTSGLMKMAWIRDPSVPAGKPADGTYRCPGTGCKATIGPLPFGTRPPPCATCGTQLDGHGWIEGLGTAPSGTGWPKLVPGKTGPAFQEAD